MGEWIIMQSKRNQTSDSDRRLEPLLSRNTSMNGWWLEPNTAGGNIGATRRQWPLSMDRIHKVFFRVTKTQIVEYIVDRWHGQSKLCQCSLKQVIMIQFWKQPTGRWQGQLGYRANKVPLVEQWSDSKYCDVCNLEAKRQCKFAFSSEILFSQANFC